MHPSDHSQAIQVNLSADVDERGRRYPRHNVVVVPRSKVLFLQSDAVIHLGIEVLRGELVEYPSTVERRCAL